MKGITGEECGKHGAVLSDILIQQIYRIEKCVKAQLCRIETSLNFPLTVNSSKKNGVYAKN